MVLNANDVWLKEISSLFLVFLVLSGSNLFNQFPEYSQNIFMYI